MSDMEQSVSGVLANNEEILACSQTKAKKQKKSTLPHQFQLSRGNGGKPQSNVNGRFVSAPSSVCARCRQNKVKCCPAPNSSSCQNCLNKGLVCVRAHSILKKKHKDNQFFKTKHSSDASNAGRSAGVESFQPILDEIDKPDTYPMKCLQTEVGAVDGMEKSANSKNSADIRMGCCASELDFSVGDPHRLDLWLRCCIPKARKQTLASMLSELLSEEVQSVQQLLMLSDEEISEFDFPAALSDQVMIFLPGS